MFKSIKILYEFLKVKLLCKSKPLFVTFSLTNRCNCSCNYCDLLSKYSSRELETEEVLSIIDKLACAGTLQIHFTGGEPLLRDDFIEIIARAKKKKMLVSFATNGLLLAEKFKQIENNVDKIAINFDGSKEIIDQIKGKGVFDRIIAALELIKNSEIDVILAVVLTKNNTNIGCVEEILKMAKEYRTKVSFQPAIKFSNGNPSDYAPDKVAYGQIMDFILKKKNTGNSKVIINSKSGLKFLKKWPGENKGFNCPAGQIYFRIRADGKFCLCGLKEELVCDAVYDNIKKQYNFKNVKQIKGNCQTCWCAARIEMAQIWECNLEALSNAYKISRM